MWPPQLKLIASFLAELSFSLHNRNVSSDHQMDSGLLCEKNLRQSQRQAAGSSEFRKSCSQTVCGRNHQFAGHRTVELFVRIHYDQSIHNDKINMHHFHSLLRHSVRPRKEALQSDSRHPAHLGRPLHVHLQIDPVQHDWLFASSERIVSRRSPVDDGPADHATNRAG